VVSGGLGTCRNVNRIRGSGVPLPRVASFGWTPKRGAASSILAGRAIFEGFGRRDPGWRPFSAHLHLFVRNLVWTLAILAVILVALPLLGMLGMMATGSASGMMGMSGGMMSGMSAVGVVWMLAAVAVVTALIVLLIRGIAHV
jgi:hypothetical protein